MTTLIKYHNCNDIEFMKENYVDDTIDCPECSKYISPYEPKKEGKFYFKHKTMTIEKHYTENKMLEYHYKCSLCQGTMIIKHILRIRKKPTLKDIKESIFYEINLYKKLNEENKDYFSKITMAEHKFVIEELENLMDYIEGKKTRKEMRLFRVK